MSHVTTVTRLMNDGLLSKNFLLNLRLGRFISKAAFSTGRLYFMRAPETFNVLFLFSLMHLRFHLYAFSFLASRFSMLFYLSFVHHSLLWHALSSLAYRSLCSFSSFIACVCVSFHLDFRWLEISYL